MTQEEVLDSIKEHVTYAKQLFDIVQFSPEDATRTDMDFLIKVYKQLLMLVQLLLIFLTL